MALIPASFLDAVVALGIPRAATQWIGTGWLYLAVQSREGDRATGEVFLLTNRHVVEGHVELSMRCNPHGSGPAQEFTISLLRPDGARLWATHAHEEVDVAVVPIRFDSLREADMQVQVVHSDRHAMRCGELIEAEVSEGDGAFVLGFPIGLVGGGRSAVIVRSGTIARIRDLLNEQSTEFLLDVFVFPGNSGGPVILRPEVMSIRGTKAQPKSVVIGMVASYVPYQNFAVSAQTGRPRVIFEENTGLAAAHPIDCIDDVVQQYRLERTTAEPAPEDAADVVRDDGG